jgi:hypothetical protein
MSPDAQPIAAGEAPAASRTATSTLLAAAMLIAGSIVLLWYAPDSYQIYKALHVIASSGSAATSR